MEMAHPFKIAATAFAFFFSICVMIYIDMLSHKNWQTDVSEKKLEEKKTSPWEQFSQVQQAMIEEEKWAAPSMTYFRPHFMVSIMMIIIIIVIVIIRLAN